MEKTLCGYFSSDSVELWDCDRMRDADYHLEAAEHDFKESLVEVTLSELYECIDILRTPTNRLRRKSKELDDVKLCEEEIIIGVECGRSEDRRMCQRTTCIRLMASVLVNN